MLSSKEPLRALCRLTGLLAPGQKMPGYNRTRALFGPLRGMLLLMPGIDNLRSPWACTSDTSCEP